MRIRRIRIRIWNRIRNTRKKRGKIRQKDDILQFTCFVQAATAADDSERMKKVLQNKSEDDEKRMAQLEEQLKDARYGYDALLAII